MEDVRGLGSLAIGFGVNEQRGLPPFGRILLAVLLLNGLIRPVGLSAQAPPPAATDSLLGRVVEDVRVVGNQQVPTAVILNAVRTRPGDRYDPATVEEDYRRVYGLRKFANVEAKVEPTDTGVVVVFLVSEQKQVTDIAYRGNVSVATTTLTELVDLKVGESIDRFRINLARQSIENLYRERNFPFAHVEVLPEPLANTGEVIFNIVEGPDVRVRKVEFVGNRSFTKDRLKEQVQTKHWIFIFRPGTFSPETVEEDVAALRRFYEHKGFFDVRVGRKLIFSPDQSEMQVSYLIEEGARYVVDRVTFKGISGVSEARLRQDLKLLEGRYYDNEVMQRDIRQMVRAYSPLGYIYQPGSDNPDYLRIEARPVFRREAGKVELVYQIREGKPFRMGRILVKGNSRTQDKVVLREMRVAPGQMYNSGELQDAVERLRATPYFSDVLITPIGDEPAHRDVLVEVTEARTALFNIGAGVNSNGGVGGNITFEQRNFDISNWPGHWSEIFSGDAFVGAGQSFRISLEPGTEQTNASIRFSEPWLFDQPYSFTGEAYLRQRRREHYDEDRAGGRVSFGRRFGYVWSTLLTLRGEDIEIDDVEDEPIRAPEIVEAQGHSTLTSVALQVRRDTTNRGLLPWRGSTTTAAWEPAGALGGDFNFHRLTLSVDSYHLVYEDLLDRKTVLVLRGDTGYITGEAPFFERFYGGGIGSIRGFRFRGVSPRSGMAEDPVGGDFFVTGSVELNFPLAGESLRGVVFSDAGTVEEEFRAGTIRTSIGAGIRLVLPIFGQAPLALDFAVPLNKDDEDDRQLISFSFGFVQ